jgi:hypothetical protein
MTPTSGVLPLPRLCVDIGCITHRCPAPPFSSPYVYVCSVQLLLQVLNFLCFFLLLVSTYVFEVGLLAVIIRQFRRWGCMPLLLPPPLPRLCPRPTYCIRTRAHQQHAPRRAHSRRDTHPHAPAHRVGRSASPLNTPNPSPTVALRCFPRPPHARVGLVAGLYLAVLVAYGAVKLVSGRPPSLTLRSCCPAYRLGMSPKPHYRRPLPLPRTLTHPTCCQVLTFKDHVHRVELWDYPSFVGMSILHKLVAAP